LFLNTRLAFWVAFGLPIAFLGMFMFAGYFNVTINVLSLFGMIIVIGILVDDGIVIAENIYQHYEKGKTPEQAAVDGVMEVLPAILSAILTTIIAFSIFLFLDGMIGDFFGEVSVIVILTLAVSLVEALIILPAHLAHSKALRKQKNIQKNGLAGLFQRIFSKLRLINTYGDKIMKWLRDKLYSPSLRFTLQNKFLTFSLFIVFLILTGGSFGGGIIRGAFFPQIASDRISITLNMPNGTNEKVTDSIISYIEKKSIEATNQINNEYLGENPENHLVKNFIKKIGPGSSAASLTINLLPGEERPNEITSSLVTNRIEELVGPIFGIESLVFGSGGNFGGRPVSVSLLGNNITELKAVKSELKKHLQDNTSLKDVTDNDPSGIKEIQLKLNETAYALGLNLRTVMSQVRAGFFGSQAQRFQRGQDEIRVWVRYDRERRSSIKNLDDMRILVPNGNRVPLKEIASYEIKRGDVAINHLESRREIQVSSDIKDPKKTSSTDIMAEIKNDIMPGILAKYPTVTPSYEGQNREQSKLTDSLTPIGLAALLLIYIVIAFTFRSYSQPLLLLFLIPFSLPAVAWGHWIHDYPVNILSMLGIIALIGIMVNDGLVLIGKFNNNLREGLSFDDALYEAGRARFRAIFLTSITTVAGLAPLIFEESRQAQFLIPMAISIAYGIGFATVLTLIVLPIFLSFSNNVKTTLKWLQTGNRISKEEVERVTRE
jgi:multidrug efflux pump subunit AcrB